MSRGLTIADMVQQVLYAIYKVRLDVDESVEGSFHCKSDKFKEIVMEMNFVLQEFQKDQDWNFLRERLDLGLTHGTKRIQEFQLPEYVYKICTGFNDAVRLHSCHNPVAFEQIPFTSPRSGNIPVVDMFDRYGRMNVDANRQEAFVIDDVLTFKRPWLPHEQHRHIETDIIRYIEPLHICDNNCPDHCPQAYEEKHFKWMPDPYYFIVRCAARRAEGDPSATDRVQSLNDEGTKILAQLKTHDSAKTTTDTYQTCELGYIEVL